MCDSYLISTLFYLDCSETNSSYGFFFSRGKPCILKQPSNICKSEFTRKIEAKPRDPGVKRSAGTRSFTQEIQVN